MTPQEFATLVLQAQDIREKSYIDLGSNEANVIRAEYDSYALDHLAAAEAT